MALLADVQAIGRHLDDRIEHRDVQSDALEPAARGAFQRAAARLSLTQVHLARALHLTQVSAYYLEPVAPAGTEGTAAERALRQAAEEAEEAQLTLRAAQTSTGRPAAPATARPRRQLRKAQQDAPPSAARADPERPRHPR
ncbi:hypothetical protein ABH940_005568 [Streptacidiphilus sp. BW17]|uniref:hypothetical protein n=1 Tax=Streptacidiphilus sp. BW17 TaxID=3156274 RepID=UPI0035145182